MLEMADFSSVTLITPFLSLSHYINTSVGFSLSSGLRIKLAIIDRNKHCNRLNFIYCFMLQRHLWISEVSSLASLSCLCRRNH